MKTLDSISLEELERFRGIRQLRNHWAEPIGRPAYFWYLTFENTAQLHSLVRECQKAISFPYYDLTPVNDLHLTIDRVAFDGDITREQLAAIETASKRACRNIASFDVTIGALGGTAGAIGFTAFPAQPIRDLRNTLRGATLSVIPEAPVKHSEFHPHVTIAYANCDAVPATEAIAAVETHNPTARVDVTITEGTLVLLERRQHSYSWQAVARAPLSR